MKKTLFLMLGVLLSFSLAQAILPSFGIKGGVNMAKYVGSDAGSTDMKMGIAAGAFACVDLIALKVQPEILFSQKGAKEEYNVLGIPTSVSNTLNYIEVPILVKFSFGKIIVPSIYAGPSFGMLLSANAKATAVGMSYSEDIKDYINSTDLGLVFGAEVKLPVKLSAEARYNLGLSKVPKEVSGIQADVKNSTISLMLGYYLF